MDITKKPIGDLLLMDFDQTNKLTGEHTAILRYHGSPDSVICQWIFRCLYYDCRYFPATKVDSVEITNAGLVRHSVRGYSPNCRYVGRTDISAFFPGD